jgi:endonuclease YncB( thermonuclease family)
VVVSLVSGYDKHPDPDPWAWLDWLFVVLALAGMVSCTVFTHAKAEPVSYSQIHVDDGDTIHLKGDKRGIRLVGFNAPESTKLRATCEAELRMGVIAKARLKQLIVRASAIDLRFVACSCRPGTEGTEKCNFGRRCAYLSADGVDVGDTLISDGMAEPLHCGPTKCPPMPRPWCS